MTALDWKGYVRERLTLTKLSAAREAELIEDLAQQLEEAYREALRRGATEGGAREAAEQHITDWAAFSREMAETEARHQTTFEERAMERLQRSDARKRSALWTDLAGDVLYGVRLLRKNPGFTLVAVITLALGIGANTAIFGVIHGVLLRPLPFADAERLVAVWESRPEKNLQRNGVSGHEYPQWVKQSKSMERLAAFNYSDATFNLAAGGAEPVSLFGVRVTASFFPTLGVQPILGRFFLEEEDKPGAPRVVMLSYDTWQTHFGADRSIAGKTVKLNDESYNVVGVMPAGFAFPMTPPEVKAVQVWAPIAEPIWLYRGRHYLFAFGKLKAGVGIAEASAEFETIAQRLEQAEPALNKGHRVFLAPLHAEMVEEVRLGLLALYASAGVLLLIACANVASMLLARGAGRQREMAIRAALGAGPFRLARQLMVESLLICLTGATAGVLLAVWLMPALMALSPVTIPRVNEIGMNGTVLGATVLLSLVTGLVFGFARTRQALRGNPNVWLKEGGAISAGASRHRLLSGLVVTEVALAVMLLAAAGVMVKSLDHLLSVNAGFQPEHVWTMDLTIPASRYPKAQDQSRFYSNLLERIQSLPGVSAAGLINHLPLGGSQWGTFMVIEGRPDQPMQDLPMVGVRVSSPGYLSAMGIPLMDGRTFTDADARRAVPLIRWYEQQPLPAFFDAPQPAPVALVSQTTARRYWPNANPIGRRFRIIHSPWITIVGVVGDVRHRELQRAADPEIYLMAQHEPQSTMNVMVRTARESDAMAAALRQAVWAVDKDQPIRSVRPMSEVVGNSVSQPRFSARLTAAFALVALLLAAIGVYGVISFATGQRTREMGVRLALGAQPRDILRLVLGHGAALILLGVGIGLAGVAALSQVMAKLLFETSPTDTATLALVTLVLVAVGMLACYLPARRATRVDPLIALRSE